MTFDLQTIAIFAVSAVIYSAIIPKNLRGWALMSGSVIAIYWLQPPIVVGRLDFIFPTATIALTIALWWFTRIPDLTPRPPLQRMREGENEAGSLPVAKGWGFRGGVNENTLAIFITIALVMGMSAMRFVDKSYRLTPSYTPHPLTTLLWLTIVGAVIMVAWWVLRRVNQSRVMAGLILLVVGIFVILKTEALALEVSRFAREQVGRDPDLARTLDLNWLGFSYVAFRLIHTLRDRQTGKLPALTLREFLTYVIFFPSFTAGPIDRAERFIKDFRALPDKVGMDAPRFTEGTTRIMVGIFKKFVIADTLALGMALNATNAEQVTSTLGLWVLLYGYALRLFFDFAGYSDIAIGIGILFGIKLPENFDRPYLRNNLTVFWQSWHITLSNWARFYVFMPFTRFLMTHHLVRKVKPSMTLITLLAQMATMVTIGLWHGVTVNFILWGVWHGAGLFIHKKWTDRTRQWYRELSSWRKQAWTVGGWFITFQFVVMGWVWFALPGIDQSLAVFGRLFGVGG